MRLLFAALYTGALLAASGVAAQDLAALQDGDMRKLQIHDAPVDVSTTAFEGDDGAETVLQDLKGEVAVVNFWATWCAPCRKEMPTLAKLQQELGDEGVRVVPIATGRNDPMELDSFLQEVGAEALPHWRDPSQALARDMGVLGLPITVILNREGQEVARLQGDADWLSESALAILRAIAAEGAEG
ncbi:Thiol:disulfide oxidoreductase TlpA [Rubellimicrobium mesophilum DSM 19309]|uniref:Thiol:disulfide oxidoreductase TlpA n=1 Tax=Rubellimicrobium mesophilum DSM 19309 TaxID=442562 RepID=A0A017HJU3_9RHOB|nr:TlpA disulfide reductase family protein [Rubellimicrobium mesophilum]EYD74580.1 Thiol:disulfide oxidoreductase TlpA [Rubellimicrobium mesophilum DSM 19309]